MKGSIADRPAVLPPKEKEDSESRELERRGSAAEDSTFISSQRHPIDGLQAALGNRAAQKVLKSRVWAKTGAETAEDTSREKAGREELGSEPERQLAVAPGSGDGNHRNGSYQATSPTSAQKQLLRRASLRILQQSLGNKAVARLIQESPVVPSSSNPSSSAAPSVPPGSAPPSAAAPTQASAGSVGSPSVPAASAPILPQSSPPATPAPASASTLAAGGSASAASMTTPSNSTTPLGQWGAPPLTSQPDVMDRLDPGNVMGAGSAISDELLPVSRAMAPTDILSGSLVPASPARAVGAAPDTSGVAPIATGPSSSAGAAAPNSPNQHLALADGVGAPGKEIARQTSQQPVGKASPPASTPPARGVDATPDSSAAAPTTPESSGPAHSANSNGTGTASSKRPSHPVTAAAGASAGANAAESARATNQAGAGAEPIGPGAPTAPVPPGKEAPTAPAVQIDASSSTAILESLAKAPATGFAAALTAAKAKLPAVQSREKRAAQDAVPVIDTPTGMPAVATPPVPARAAFPPIQTPTAPVAASNKVAPPPPTPQTAGPVPGSQVPLPKDEPVTTDDSGSWWSWLTDRLHSFFGSLPTSDPNLSTSAGERQRIALDGDADPAQNAREREASGRSVQAGRSQADSAIPAHFGEEAIAPTVPPSKSKAAYRPAPGRAPAASPPVKAPPKLTANERAMFDERAAPMISGPVGEQDAGYQQQQAIYQRAVKQAQDDGARQLADENARTRAEQLALRDSAKADVGGARKQWSEENRKIAAEFDDKSSAKRQEVDRQISQKVDATHRDADAAYDEADKKAEAEKTKAEADAEAKKKEEENKPRSWWDRAKGAISDTFNAIRGAITAIFDKLRAAVKTIIDTAKKAVHSLIEAARSAIVGMIQAFGDFVKGLVTVALAAFPNAAAKARAWIDDRVKSATDAVNRAAKALEKAVDAILDRIAQTIDKALDVLQAALNKAIDVLENVALLPFKIASALETFWEIMKLLKSGFLERLFELAKDPKKVAQLIVAKVEPLAGQVPPKADQLAVQKGQEGGTPEPAASSGRRTTVQRQSAAPEKSFGDKAAELILEGGIKQDPPKIPASAPGEGFWSGVWRHMKAAGNHFLENWVTTLINLVYSLLLFYPVLLNEGPKLWEECKGVIYGGGGVDRFDHVLGVLRQLVNIIAGLVATTGIWAFIIALLFPPAEIVVVPAYLAISAGVIAADIVVGLAEMGKAWYSATRDGISTKTRETYLSMFSSSAISTAIVIILVIIGAIASRLAKAFKAWRAGAGEAGEPVKPTGEKPKETDPAGEKEAPKISDNPDKLVICRVCDTVPGVPADLMTKRAALSPEARARLDQKATGIFTDPAHPTPQQFDSLRDFMDALERRGQGSLEKGLQDLMETDAKFKWGNPKSGPTYGHTFLDHTQRLKPQQLIDRATAKGHQIGQWLDDKAAADFIADVAQKGPGTYDVPVPARMGRSFLPNGTELRPDMARVVVKPDGSVRTAFPYNSAHPN